MELEGFGREEFRKELKKRCPNIDFSGEPKVGKPLEDEEFNKYIGREWSPELELELIELARRKYPKREIARIWKLTDKFEPASVTGELRIKGVLEQFLDFGEHEP